MANIKTHLNNIKGALYGKDVRESIHDGISAINKEVENTTSRQIDLESTFDQLVINAGNSNAEIVDARVKSDGTSYSKLGDRLNAVDSQLDQKLNKNELTYINVKDFGAKGDGVTDDRLAIQSALDYAKEQGGCKIIFPKGIYLIDSTKDTHGLILEGGKIQLLGNGEVIIKANVPMTNLIYVPTNAYYFTMENLKLDGNYLTKCCFRANEEYSPYMTLRNCEFQKANEVNVNISTWMSVIDHCIFNHGVNGLLIQPVGDNICTSITMTSCYVNNMRGEYGYHLKNCMYTTMNSCACDNIKNGVCYEITHGRGFVMNGCGCEKSLQPIKINAFRGFTINGFYGYRSGSDTLDYLIEFGGGKDATISGVCFESCPSRYVLGLVDSSYGYENITVTDDCIRKSDIYYVSNWKFTNPIKLLRDETTKDLTITCSLNDLADTFNNLPVVINHNITITITDGKLDKYVSLKNKRGSGLIQIDLSQYDIKPTTAHSYGLYVNNVDVNMIIKNGTISQTNPHNYGEVAKIENSKIISFNSVNFVNASGGKGGSAVSSHKCSIVNINNCTSSGTFGSDNILSKLHNDGLSILNGTL